MQRDVSYVNIVSTFLRVASSRSHPTTIRFSGHASAHKLHPMHSVSPVSGFLFSRGAPRYRSATIGRSSGYCSVQIFFGNWVRNVTAMPFRKSAWNIRSTRFMLSVSFPHPLLSRTLATLHGLNSFLRLQERGIEGHHPNWPRANMAPNDPTLPIRRVRNKTDTIEVRGKSLSRNWEPSWSITYSTQSHFSLAPPPPSMRSCAICRKRGPSEMKVKTPGALAKSSPI